MREVVGSIPTATTMFSPSISMIKHFASALINVRFWVFLRWELPPKFVLTDATLSEALGFTALGVCKNQTEQSIREDIQSGLLATKRGATQIITRMRVIVGIIASDLSLSITRLVQGFRIAEINLFS